MRHLQQFCAWMARARVAPLACIVAGLVIAAAATAAEPNSDNPQQQRPTVCTQQYAPVCGEIKGVTKTYSNACFAAAAGAKVIAQGPCR
jgi:hypothetical protein